MSDAATLAEYVRILGRGPGRSRNLTREEAAAALGIILEGRAAPEAVGALFMLLRYRGENGEEIAGFVDAIRSRIHAWQNVPAAIDWPTYAAGRSRGAPWFLLSAKLVAAAGAPVLLHGWNSASNAVADVRSKLAELDIPVVETPHDAVNALGARGVAYAPLEAIDPELFRLLRLRDVLGLRSPINTALRAMNPTLATTSLAGVFHPSYRELQQEAAATLGQPRLLALKGGGGEFERAPGKTVTLFGLAEGSMFEIEAPPRLDVRQRLKETAMDDPAALWRGEADDPFAAAIVVGTAAAAMFGARLAPDMSAADAMAERLWRDRTVAAAA